MDFFLLASSKDWFDYTRDVITMIGYLATIGTFLYLFRRDNDKQEQIDQLTKLAIIAEEELVLSVMPDLYKNGVSTRPIEKTINVDLLNRGENAILLEFNSKSEDITLLDNSLPYVLEKNKERLILMKSNGKHVEDCKYEIEILYEDKLKNKYKMIVSGTGHKVNFRRPTLFQHRSGK